MPRSNIPSPSGAMKEIILIIAACLTLQVTAADKNQSTTSNEAATPDQAVQQSGAAGDNGLKNQEPPMEEITVIGRIFNLRQKIIVAEDHAFKIFNALNDDDDYDVHCEMVARTGTLIKKRMCLPNFYHRATADEAQVFLGIIGMTTYSPAVPSARNVFNQKFPIFKDKVKKLAMENPEMLDALKKLISLKEELDEQRNVAFGKTEQ